MNVFLLFFKKTLNNVHSLGTIHSLTLALVFNLIYLYLGSIYYSGIGTYLFCMYLDTHTSYTSSSRVVAYKYLTSLRS